MFACNAPPLESPVPDGSTWVDHSYPLSLRDKVDILFLVDNSNSMDAMQAELRGRFEQFFRPFQQLAHDGSLTDLHIGVVTSDYGAGSNSGSCDASPGGERGRLQALGRAAPVGCRRPVGDNFVRYRFGPKDTVAASNLPDGQGLIETFTCMASVGSSGCGFEHQLEAVYAALHNDIPENRGFFRADAILVVVFLTNEDDASAPPDTDVFNKDLVSRYGYVGSYSRQTRFAVMCCPPGRADCADSELRFPPYDSSHGPLAGCRPAPNFPVGSGPGKQYDVSRYIDFFTRPAGEGGVKLDPHDVVLVGIDAPEAPFEVILANPTVPTGQPYVTCGALDDRGSPPCSPVLQHACRSPNHPGFFGDPAVRLNTVIRAAPTHQISSICADDYSDALTNAASLVIATARGGCLPARLPRDGNGQLVADCEVTMTTLHLDGSATSEPLARCPGDGPNPDPSIPCWRIEAQSSCASISPDGVAIRVEARDLPPLASARYTCVVAP